MEQNPESHAIREALAVISRCFADDADKFESDHQLALEAIETILRKAAPRD
ncbi:hypothetical protein ABZW96_36380 [Nocardia sp. NPDC004168]|uniref:hypothetical protein n=1 Tax=Nocardia sp. NPDC004168 TaxID=3154452 RepID=UPI0033B7857D